MTKYKAIKTTIDGITFDSKKEARRYQELKLMEKAGVIDHLHLQPKFEILPKHKDIEGNTVRAVVYKADFHYFDLEQRIWIVEDVKGFKTPLYKLKKKLVEHKHKIKIVEI